MDRAGDELLPGSGLSLHQNRDLRRDHLLEKLDDPEHLGAAADEKAVAEVLFQRATEVLVLDLQAALGILEGLVHPRVLQRDGAERPEALEQRDAVGREFVRDRMGIDVEHPEHVPRIQDRERDHRAERQFPDALVMLEQRRADGIRHPDGLPTVCGLLGDAPGDLEFVGRKRGLVLVAGDLEMKLAVLAHEHQESPIGVRDLDHGVDNADQKLIQVERAGDGSRGLEDVRDAIEIGYDTRSGRRSWFLEKFTFPLRQAPAEPFKRVDLGHFGRAGIPRLRRIWTLRHGSTHP